MSEKKYKSSEGFECTLSQMVKIEPEWAVNRIRVCEKLEAENKALKEELKTTQDIAFELTESLRKEGIELGKVKASRNELLHWLEAISVHVKDVETRNAVNLICAKAQALKEKEA